jgi:hypothetical protein
VDDTAGGAVRCQSMSCSHMQATGQQQDVQSISRMSKTKPKVARQKSLSINAKQKHYTQLRGLVHKNE